MDEVLAIALYVEGVLERMGVRHVVAGSLASSLHGIPRATQDIDFVADLRAEHVEAIVGELLASFYIDASAVSEAVRDRTRFNAIHLETMFKVDVYLPELDDVAEQQFARGVTVEVDQESGQTLVVASAEDTILQKLRWYRLGAESSVRQWRDALGVLQVQGPHLDRDYLHETAAKMGLEDELQRALMAASGGEPA